MVSNSASHSAQEQLEDLLDVWEDHRDAGRDISIEELCQSTPELTSLLRERVRLLDATQWLMSDETERHCAESQTVALSDPATDTELPDTTLSVEEFSQQITDNGVIDESELQRYRQLRADNQSCDATALANDLVKSGKLTSYQARVVLERSNDPLLLDRYLILDTLDSGGMGLVFKALHRAMERVVALKILPSFAVDSPDKVERFRREAKAAAKLSHPNIATAFDADHAGGTHFLVMEYVPGTDLNKHVKRNGALSVEQAVACILQAARGLGHAHKQGVIHRDIKPGNLILSQDGTIKIIDMGLARILPPSLDGVPNNNSDMTGEGIVMGTVAYMSPEQALETRQADARSDIYSLGATFHYLLTGRSLYSEPTSLKTLVAHREQPVPSLTDVRADVPDKLNALFQRMVAKSPNDRFASIAEVIDALEACGVDTTDVECGGRIDPKPTVTKKQRPNGAMLSDARSLDSTSQEPTLDYDQMQPPSQRNRKWFVAGAGGLFVLLAGIIIVIQTPDGKTTRIEVPKGSSISLEETGDQQQSAQTVESSVPEHRHAVNSLGMEFTLLPKGTFWFGGGSGVPGHQQLAITEDFYFGTYEVTQAQWQEVMGENPSYFARTGEGANLVKDISDEELRQFPVESVNWHSATEFARKLTEKFAKDSGWVYRLPTEAEWEYACRGGGSFSKEHYGFDYYFDAPTEELSPALANYIKSDLKRPTKVGSYPPNSLGLHDMHGNVREWCQDLLYLSPKNAHRPRRRSLGGNWLETDSGCAAGARGYLSSRDVHGAYGFRIVLARADGAASQASKVPLTAPATDDAVASKADDNSVNRK